MILLRQNGGRRETPMTANNKGLIKLEMTITSMMVRDVKANRIIKTVQKHIIQNCIDEISKYRKELKDSTDETRFTREVDVIREHFIGATGVCADLEHELRGLLYEVTKNE